MHNHRKAIFGGAAAISSFVAVGAGTAAGAAPSPQPSTMHQSSAATIKTLARLQVVAKPTTLRTATTSVDGKSETILVNAKGLPLYYYQADTAKRSNVNGELLRLWPPLISAKPTATGTQGKLAAKDGNDLQVTYNGHFLYTFVDDAPGHVTGQGVSNFFVATPGLKTISVAAKTTTPAPASGGRYGY
jgi:predicted lipoprotein with Yx(FWY)xxD motif